MFYLFYCRGNGIVRGVCWCDWSHTLWSLSVCVSPVCLLAQGVCVGCKWHTPTGHRFWAPGTAKHTWSNHNFAVCGWVGVCVCVCECMYMYMYLCVCLQKRKRKRWEVAWMQSKITLNGVIFQYLLDTVATCIQFGKDTQIDAFN